MKYVDKKAVDVKIAYIGGGSRGWAWGLMNDLAQAPDMSGSVALYDIDYEAAQHNEAIGNSYNKLEGCLSQWKYKAYNSIDKALKGADFVIISILPGTFDEMESDVHTPEKYGIYQSVGDTVGPGGIIRALRTIPMFEVIAKAIKKNCPNAWVINYTNPMTVCVRTLYKVFPEIKAFGCCHEVFGTQKVLAACLEENGYGQIPREEVKVNVVGINHFTWITSAHYKNVDIMPLYAEYAKTHVVEGDNKSKDNNWMNNSFASANCVKFDLFNKFGVIAAAGDRHLAEFCEGDWYLHDPETVKKYKFGLTTVAYRKNELKERLKKSEELLNGTRKPTLWKTGEEGVLQMRALLGLTPDFVTNMNIPNVGQIPNLPLGAVVETNACLASDTLTPVFAGNIPASIYNLITRVVGEQEMVVEAGLNRDLELAFRAFINDANVNLPFDQARALFDEMVENTKTYLTEYFQ